MAITKLVADSLGASAVPNQSAFKNIIINGDMSIAQRGTSQASITSGGYYTLDRFQTSISGLGTWTQSQSTEVPSGQGFSSSLKMDCTTADASPSANDSLFLKQKIEGQNLQYLKKGTASAESLTLSFWVRSNKTGTYCIELRDVDNTRQFSQAYTISSADTWEKKTLTFAGDTTGTLNNDNGSSLEVSFWLGAGTNFTSGTLQSWGSYTNANRAVGQVNLADNTANEWYITGVQLEAGTTASDFEFLPVDVNLQRCQRYFDKQGGGGVTYNSTNGGYFVKHSVAMRATPTKTMPDLTNAAGIFGVGDYTPTSFTTNSGTENNKITHCVLSGLPSSTVGIFSSLKEDTLFLDAEL